MKYFLLHTDPDYETAPSPVNWYGIIDQRHIDRRYYRQIPHRSLLSIRQHAKTVYTSIVDTPFFLVSEVVKGVIELYDSTIPFRQVVLMDSQNETAELYFLPFFEKVACLSEQSATNLDKSVLQKPVLLKSAVKERPLFRVGDVSGTYIVARMDVVESILQRPVQGVGMTPVQLAEQ